MKRIKMIVSAAAVLALVGGIYAFAPTKKFPANLYQKLIASPQTCQEADATKTNTGLGTRTVPATHTGFYTTDNCTGTTVTGYIPNVQ
jgi:hypothetical protein